MFHRGSLQALLEFSICRSVYKDTVWCNTRRASNTGCNDFTGERGRQGNPTCNCCGKATNFSQTGASTLLFSCLSFFLGDDHQRNSNDILLGNCLSQTADFCQLKCSRGKLVGGWGSTSNVLRSKQQRRRRIPQFRGTTPPEQSVDFAVLQQHRSTKFFGKG